MALDNIIKRISILNDLIQKEQTGNASNLARALGMSKRQVYNYISEFNKIGRGVRYDPERGSYVYVQEASK